MRRAWRLRSAEQIEGGIMGAMGSGSKFPDEMHLRLLETGAWRRGASETAVGCDTRLIDAC